MTEKEVIGALIDIEALFLERRIMHEGMTPEQAATVLGVSSCTVKRWCDAGRLECVRKTLGQRRITAKSVGMMHDSLFDNSNVIRLKGA